jgi:hypothetical protein
MTPFEFRTQLREKVLIPRIKILYYPCAIKKNTSSYLWNHPRTAKSLTQYKTGVSNAQPLPVSLALKIRNTLHPQILLSSAPPASHNKTKPELTVLVATSERWPRVGRISTNDNTHTRKSCRRVLHKLLTIWTSTLMLQIRYD